MSTSYRRLNRTSTLVCRKWFATVVAAAVVADSVAVDVVAMAADAVVVVMVEVATAAVPVAATTCPWAAVATKLVMPEVALPLQLWKSHLALRA